MRAWGVSIVLLFGLTALAQAKPLDLKHVPADVQWVAHMDVDAMRASPVIEKAFQAASEEWPDQLEGHMDRSARRSLAWICRTACIRLPCMVSSLASPPAC